jgi:hypothetical protein
MAHWEAEYQAQTSGASNSRSSTSFTHRLQNAPDDDHDVPMPEDPFLLDTNESPLQQLIRHWINERHAPDILPAQEQLLSGLLDHIRKQVTSKSPALAYHVDELSSLTQSSC